MGWVTKYAPATPKSQKIIIKGFCFFFFFFNSLGISVFSFGCLGIFSSAGCSIHASVLLQMPVTLGFSCVFKKEKVRCEYCVPRESLWPGRCCFLGAQDRIGWYSGGL